MINKAVLLGHIGKKETKTTKNGSNLTVMSIATRKKWKDQAGEPKEKTTWHIVNCFGKLADIASKYVAVGNLIYIEGEINYDKIENELGEGKYYYSVTASELKLLPSGKKENKESIGNQKPDLNNLYGNFEDDPIPF